MIYNQDASGMEGLGVLPLSTDPIMWQNVAQAYTKVLGREPESRESMQFWADWLMANGNSPSLLEAQLKTSQEYIQGHPVNQTPASTGLPNLPSIPSTIFGLPVYAVGGIAAALAVVAVMKSRR